MLDGVTVLNTINIEVPLIAVLMCVLGLLLGLILSGYGMDENSAGHIIVGACLISFFMVLCIFLFTYEPQTKYEVTIDDSVSMTEFYAKFEIVNQRGDIYTIKERPTE